MLDPNTARITGQTTDDVLQSCNEVAPQLPPAERERFTVIRLEYLVTYGMNGTSDRMRGKTVRQIIDEYSPSSVEPVESGSLDGLEYSLYEAAEPDSDDGSVDNGGMSK